ncbi:MAG: diadenylate cyclase CdaA [Desulfocucumaceae bacterium]
MLELLKSMNFNLLDIFSLTSVIDIAIVAFVLYRLMLLIKGTRAVQLLKGLAVLVVATAASSLFQLYTLQWILKQAITALVVALPIVFQPELRRALEKLGGGRFFSRQFTVNGEADIGPLVAEMVRAVRIMSKDRTGALIVLERSTGLEEYIDSGIKVAGKVSGELLVNIFIPRTPLHDGAVIIRGDRIMAAACVLPLTQGHVSKSMGTRHRAGIGITEESDALAVIVSEETGTVSLAVEGVLSGGLDEKLLSERLTGALKPKKQTNLAAFWSRR